jgi:hypothetical protein
MQQRPFTIKLLSMNKNYAKLRQMDVNTQDTILQKFKKYRVLWIIGAIPIGILGIGLAVGAIIAYVNSRNWYRFEPAVVCVAVIPNVALILGLICQFRRPRDLRSLHVFMALSLIQFWLPIMFFFGFFCGVSFGVSYRVTAPQMALSVWFYFICFELLMCLAIIVLSIVFLAFQSVPTVENINNKSRQSPSPLTHHKSSLKHPDSANPDPNHNHNDLDLDV